MQFISDQGNTDRLINHLWLSHKRQISFLGNFGSLLRLYTIIHFETDLWRERKVVCCWSQLWNLNELKTIIKESCWSALKESFKASKDNMMRDFGGRGKVLWEIGNIFCPSRQLAILASLFLVSQKFTLFLTNFSDFCLSQMAVAFFVSATMMRFNVFHIPAGRSSALADTTFQQLNKKCSTSAILPPLT